MPAESAPAQDRQVLVVGGSVEGLAAAAFLRQGGFSPVVVTAGTDQSDRPRDVVLWRSAVSLLAELGVADDRLAVGTPLDEWRLHRLGLDDDSTERYAAARDGQPVVSVDRSRLRERIRSRLPAGNVRLSKTPRRLVPTDGGLRVDFADGVRERFDAVVGADGTDSWLRDARTDFSTPVSWGTEEWEVLTDGLADTTATVVDVWAPTEALFCHPGGRARFVTLATDEDDTTAARAVAAARLDALLDRTVLCDSTPTLGERTVHTGTPTTCWAAGRVAFVGPAAWSLPPTSSLDPSLAVEDASALARELTTPRGVVAALHRYARRRRSRLAALERRVPFRFAPAGTQEGAATVRTARALRTSVVRSSFPTPAATVAADAADPQ